MSACGLTTAQGRERRIPPTGPLLFFVVWLFDMGMVAPMLLK
jgi:hypothetical protein